MKRTTRLRAAALGALTIGLFAAVAAGTGQAGAAAAGPAAAAEPVLAGSADQASRPTFDVKVGKLVLTRISGHYHGALAVTAHYRGRTAAADAVLSITVPAGLRLSRANTGGPCLLGVPVRCFFGTPFQPGERRGFTIELDSYAGPDRHARITADGLIAVSTGATDPGGAAAFRGILLRRRRTGGRQPRRQLRNLARDRPLTKAPARAAILGPRRSEPEVAMSLVAEQGFDDFYAAHFGPLTAQLTAYAGDLAEAQDAVQEAFCRAWPRCRTTTAVRRWLPSCPSTTRQVCDGRPRRALHTVRPGGDGGDVTARRRGGTPDRVPPSAQAHGRGRPAQLPDRLRGQRRTASCGTDGRRVRAGGSELLWDGSQLADATPVDNELAISLALAPS